MAPDDRDRTFEKALARHLRPSASAGPDGSALSGAPADLCPDPEMLAAYHDGSLSLEERSLWKQHVLGCDRCQFVLAHLETPLEIPVFAEANALNEKVAALQPAPAAKAVSPARTTRPSLIHSLRWLWLVPAGAIAATLVAWISLQERKPLQPLPASPVEVAENRPSSAPAASPKPQPTARAEIKQAEKDRLQAESPAAVDSANRDLASNTRRNEVQLTQQAPLLLSPRASHGPSINAQKQEQQIGRIAAGTAGAALDLKKLDAPAQTKPPLSAVGGAIASVPPPPPAEPSFFSDEAISAPRKDKAPAASLQAPAPAPVSNGAAAKTKAASADAISSVTETVEVTAAAPGVSSALAKESGRMRAASLQNPRIFWAPGEKQAWRIGPAGSLEHSRDKGLTWTPQISGVYTDLLAASAPSGKVCWIVGAAGTILSTTDGGTHWSKLDSPVTNDLTGVRADDAKHVWIWFVPDQQTGIVKTYKTSDGGRTWFSIPSDH